MNLKTKVQRWVMFHLDEPEWMPWWTGDLVHGTICFFFGHTPERDQCGKPEHDFCLWCNKSMPNSWTRPKEPSS